MKRTLILCFIGMMVLTTSVAAEFLGIKSATENISFRVKLPFDSAGVTWKKPDSMHVETYADAGTTSRFLARSTTYPFSDIAVDTTKSGSDTSYVYVNQIQNIDGTAGNFLLNVWVTTYIKGLPTVTDASIQVVSDSLNDVVWRTAGFLSAVLATYGQADSLTNAIATANKVNFGRWSAAQRDSLLNAMLDANKVNLGRWTAAQRDSVLNAILTANKVNFGQWTSAQRDSVLNTILDANKVNMGRWTAAQRDSILVAIATANKVNFGRWTAAQRDSVLNSILDANKVNFGIASIDLDTLTTMVEQLNYFLGSCNGCIKKYLPNDGTAYKNGYEMWVGGNKKFTITFGHSNDAAILDSVSTAKNY